MEERGWFFDTATIFTGFWAFFLINEDISS